MKARSLSTLGTLAAAGLVLYGLAPSGTTEGSTEENPRLVEVVNGAAAPVPTTIVGGAVVSGAVQAQQSGPWSVAVSNLPTVQMVQMAPPVLESGRLAFEIYTLGETRELTIPAGVVMTDLVVDASGSEHRNCLLNLWDGPPLDASDLLVQELFVNREVFSLHLESGYEGPLTLHVRAGGTPDEGVCFGRLFWTGYRLL